MNIPDQPIAHWRASDSTPQYLHNHLQNVAAFSGSLSKKIRLEVAGELIGLLHDLGKYSKEFRDYINSALGLINPDEDDYVDSAAIRGKVDHSSAGAQFIWERLGKKGPMEKQIAQVLALCIASHHSGLIDCLDPDGLDTFGKRMQKTQEKTHLDEVRQVADDFVLTRAIELIDSPELTSGVRALIQQIAKNETQRAPLQQKIGLAIRFLFSCLIDADRIDTADFEEKRLREFRPKGDYVVWKTLIARLERHLESMVPRRPIDHLRRNISQDSLHAASRENGIYTLTVPTGGGKTLASLRFALHHANERQLDRIIYVIPFTSIIDQNAEVVRKILEPDDQPTEHGKVVLEHHSSITPEQQTWREKMLCENWDAPVVYTTMVQFLESLFGSGTRGARRMHQMGNAVLIFDEIQTLPIKCVHLFNNAINFLTEQCNSTVVLCTATQPLLHEVSAENGAIRLAPKHEIVRDVRQLFEDLKRVEVCDQRKPGGWAYTEIVRLALDELARAGSCLVIVNTKDAARQVFLACCPSDDAESFFHLSTDMCPAHRKEELKKVRERLDAGLATLCVSTQLIEAGVDVDFGVVIRSMAGLDSIAQAAGRCNRNGRPEPGIVHLVNPAEERLENLTDINIGRDHALHVLDDFAKAPERYLNNLLGPEALQDYYRYYFFNRQEDMAYPVSANELGHDDSLLNLLSGNSNALQDCQRQTGKVPERLLNQSFMAAAKVFKAIDAPTQGVIVSFGKSGADLVARLHAAYDLALEIDLLRKAQQYTVNVFPHVLEKLKQAGAVKEIKEDLRIYSLDPRYYSKQFGLATEQVSLMEILNV